MMIGMRCKLLSFLLSIISLVSLSSAFAAKASGNVVDLQQQHYVQSPVEKMKSIEEACIELGIDKFDVYGDYSEGEWFCWTHRSVNYECLWRIF
jgi:hypothetical protein